MDLECCQKCLKHRLMNENDYQKSKIKNECIKDQILKKINVLFKAHNPNFWLEFNPDKKHSENRIQVPKLLRSSF